MKHEVLVVAPLHRNRHLKELPPNVVQGRHLCSYPPKTTKLFLAYNEIVAERSIRRWRPDITHETYYAHRKPLNRSPTVITVYDMIHELFPDKLVLTDNTSALKRTAVDRADHVICISENTRSDLIRLFGTPENKVSVVHLGFEQFASREADNNGECGRTEKPFLLYVGNRGGYKNFSGFLRAFASSSRLRADFDIVSFGAGAFEEWERALIAKLGLRAHQIRHVSGSDSALGTLYDQARAFVYPSLYEGFGLPPLEAMAHRCPVVTSNTSSMPEVIGDAGEFFDPTSTDHIAQAIERVVYSENRTQELVRFGLARLNHFSWQKCADQTVSIYQNLLG